MKRFIFALCLSAMTTFTHAFDRWVDNKYEGGETVFSAGVAQLLLVGSRGLGIAVNPNTEGIVVSKEVTLKIDDEQPQQFPIQHIAASTHLIRSNEILAEKVANARKVEITYSLCWGSANACAFTFKGKPRTVSWEFDSTLSKQYPDYLTTIKQP